MAKVQARGIFPSQADPNIHTDEKGLEVGRAIESEWFRKDSGDGRFFNNRAAMHRLRLYARGEQSIQKYKDELAINGDISYLNLDWKPVPVIPKFVDIVVNGISERPFEIRAYSQDPESIKRKTDYVDSLLSDMKNQELLDAVMDSFGINMYKTDPETLPQNEEEIALKMQLDFKESIEIAEEEVINNVFDYNKYYLLKKRVDYDIATIGIGANKTEFNTAEGIVIKYVDPPNLVYSTSESPWFDDIFYVGEVAPITISELKKSFPTMTNEQIEEIENLSGGSSVHGRMYNQSPNESMDTNIVYVLNYEYKTHMDQVWKIKESISGGAKAIQKDSTFNPPQDERARFEKVDRSIEVIYCGKKIVGSDFILEWKMAENMVRPKSDTTKAKFSYNIVAPRIYRGKIESLVGRMIGFADMIQLTHLKLQQVLSRMVPDGVFLDADGLGDISLGEGIVYNPQEALNMYFQTGSVIGRSTTIDGDFNNARIPVQELTHSASNQKIQSLVASYNFYLQMIRDVTGLNEARDGSMPDKDSLVGLQKLAAANSNTATRHIVDSGLYITLQTAEAISLRVSDVLEFGNTTSSFISAIGKLNVSTLKELEELHLHDFGIFVELAPDEEQKQALENKIRIALDRDQIYLEDAIDIEEVKNLKLANQLLKLRRRKKQERDRMLQLENIQATAQANAQAAQVAAETEVQKEEAIAQTKVQINKVQNLLDITKLEKQAEIQKDLMRYEFELDMKIKQMEMQINNQKEKFKEDRKDQRTKIQASQQSELINQRNNNTPARDFESVGFDTLDGLGIERFHP